MAEIDVLHVAELARLALSEEEVQRFGSQLNGILEHVAALEKLPTADVPATAQVIPSRNVLRDDVPRRSLPRERVLEMAPSAEPPYFRVPRIIAEDL